MDMDVTVSATWQETRRAPKGLLVSGPKRPNALHLAKSVRTKLLQTRSRFRLCQA